MAVRRTAFEIAGGCPARRHGEDIQLSARIEKAGFVTAYPASARVYHRRRSSLRAFAAQVFGMGKARAALAAADPAYAEPVYFLPAAVAITGVLVLAAATLSSAA